MQNIIKVLILAWAGLFLYACGGENGGERRPSASSSGQPFELMVVYDGDTTVRNTIRRALGQPYPALPQPESWFDLRFVEIDNLVNLHKRQRNILFAGAIENENRIAEIILEMFGEETVEEVLDNPNRFYSSARDVWARPQLIIALYDRTTDELLENISKHDDFLTDQLDIAETRRFNNKLADMRPASDKVRTLRNNHNLTLHLPNHFQVLRSYNRTENEVLQRLDLDGLAWIRGETRKSNQEILLYYRDYSDKEQIDLNYIISLRDSVGKHFVPGPSEGSYMQVEQRYQPRQKEVDFNGRFAIETRGLWRVEGDFMGGPFINYTIFDESTNRIIHADGFIYAPQERKRDFVKRMEVLLKSLNITDAESPS